MKPTQAATFTGRIIGVLTLGWAYLAYTDLRWLLHLHALHLQIARSTFTFSYPGYLACNVANVAISIIAACVLLLFPSWLLWALTPASGRRSSLSAAWFTTGIGIGLILLVLGIHAILATTLWTIYRSGKDSGWQIELIIYALVAAGGVVLCRSVLAGGRVE